ncbi:MAG: S8 family serine peptidase [Lewinellaceae bacterium]|nr:S8 family serine peptidase [Lewinellaceae bacterium]
MATKKANKATFSYGGIKMSFTKSKTQGAVQYTPSSRVPKTKRTSKTAAPPDQLGEFEVFHASRSIDQKLDEQRERPDVSVGTHVWHMDGEEDASFIPTGNIYIEFKEGTDNNLEQELFEELHLNIVEVVGPDAYRVCVTPTSPNPIKCVLILQKKKFVQVAEPELLTKPVTGSQTAVQGFTLPGGRFIATQWHHENTGSQIPIIDIPNAVFGTSHFRRGADAKIKQAWQYLGNLGSRYIKIGVIDTGFATDHPQLRGDGSKVVNAFNAANRNNDVSPWFQASDGSWGVFSHGTSCAAVAAGALDEQGVLGAAPNARIVPIKLDILSDSAIKNAFEHALLNGVDIISCSLGFPKPVPLSTYITNYLSKVAREGRGGKGIPMFFAAGNANPASNNVPRPISDFAAHPDSICVTASNSLDEFSDYSFYGSNAFLCAPTNGNDGVGITTATVNAGSFNRLELGYTSGFGGTSSATPLAAGVCALMLTANPNLTLGQIKSILQQSCDKIGSGNSYDRNGHSNYFGFGRLNALKAVQMAAQAGAGGVPSSSQGTGTSTGSAAPPQQGAGVKKGKVTSKYLNVRSGPSTSYAKVGQLKYGDVVNLLNKTSGFWCIDQNQYVSAYYIQELATNGAVVSNARHGRVTSTFLNVRSGPSTAYGKVSQLKQGDTVTIYETSSNGWHRISSNSWAIGTYIQEV